MERERRTERRERRERELADILLVVASQQSSSILLHTLILQKVQSISQRSLRRGFLLRPALSMFAEFAEEIPPVKVFNEINLFLSIKDQYGKLDTT